MDRLDADLLAWLHGFSVEIAPDDYSAQRIPRAQVLAWFGLSHAELDEACTRLAVRGLVFADEQYVCLTPDGVDDQARRQPPATGAPLQP
jgi:hypothetical protein